MKEHRRLSWLLVLVLFQPSYIGADCNVTETTERQLSERRYFIDIYKYHVHCTLPSLHMNVPLTTYIPACANKVARVRSINFTSSTINTVPVGVFQAFSAVELLKMDNVYINSIEPGALRGLTQLEELNLNYNNISEIQDGTFDDLVRLKKLLMVENKLSTLKSLKGLVNLKWLDVERNIIATIDDGAFKNTVNLENLNLSRNKLVELNVDVFEELRHLVTLTMNNNRITRIPVGTFRHLGEVTTLDISFNNLTHLEYGLFGGLTSLKVLHVSDNNIAMLESKVLFPLKSLTRLNLDGNLLRTFDVDTMVSHLTTLGSISLDRNQIRCDWLTSYIHVFTLRNIKVFTGNSFKANNVHGIYCISENEQRISIPPTKVSVKVTQPLVPTTKQPVRRKSAGPTQIPSTAVFSFSKAPESELVDVSTQHVVHTRPMADHNDHAAADYNVAQVSGAENEKKQ